MSDEDHPEPAYQPDLDWVAAVLLMVCSAFGGALILLLLEEVVSK